MVYLPRNFFPFEIYSSTTLTTVSIIDCFTQPYLNLPPTAWTNNCFCHISLVTLYLKYALYIYADVKLLKLKGTTTHLISQGVLTNCPRYVTIYNMAVQQNRLTIAVENILTIPEAAKELGVHRVTIYRWIDKGIVHPFRVGRQVFLTTDEVKALKEQRANE
jgi:excisionase family DNA binding protein